MTDLSEVRCKLVGVCCFSEEKRKYVHEVWERRFHSSQAFLIDMDPNDTAKELAMKLQNRLNEEDVSMVGDNCILVFFQDLTGEISDDLFQLTNSFPHAVEGVFKPLVPICLNFGYVGDLMFSDTSICKTNANSLVENNQKDTAIRRELILVASKALAEMNEDTWLASSVLLDVLRRNENPGSLLHQGKDGRPNNEIGFLRYGEFDQETLDALNKKQQYVSRALSSEGQIEFHVLLTKYLESLAAAAREKFVVEAGFQPQHPDMIVEPGLFGVNIHKAKIGSLDSYNKAASYTRDALKATGDRMTADIQAYVSSLLGKPENVLRELFEQSRVGIEALSNRTSMQQHLICSLPTDVIPVLPSLKYKEDGCVNEIGEYLRSVVQKAIRNAVESAQKSLNKSYMEIPDAALSKKSEELQRDLADCNVKLSMVPDLSGFCTAVNGNGDILQAEFTPQLPGGSTFRCIICCKDEDVKIVEPHVPNSKCYYIHRTQGGVKDSRDLQIRGLHVLSFDCTHERLQDLIGEGIQ